MKRIIFIILLIFLTSQYAKSQNESGWLDKGNYLENKLKTLQYNIVQFSPDGRTILTYSADKIIRKWDTETGSLIKEIDMSDYRFNLYDISSDTRYFAFTNHDEINWYDDNYIHIYNIDSEFINCERIIYIPPNPAGTVFYHRFIKNNSSNNCFILSSELKNYYGAGVCGNSGMNGEYSSDSCKYINNLSGLIPYDLDKSPDGLHFVISGYTESYQRDNLDDYHYNYFLELYNMENDSSYILDHFYTENRDSIPDKTLYMCFSPDSKNLADFRDGYINIYYATNGNSLRKFQDLTTDITYLEKFMYSVDNNFLIKCGNGVGATIEFINLKSGLYKDPIIIRNTFGTCFDQSPDSSTYLIGTQDGRLLLIKDHYTSIIENFTLSKSNLLYPNPANDKAQINFSLYENSNVKITLFDFMGKEIRTLVDENKAAGDYTEPFDTGYLTEGMYFLKMETGTITSLFKLMVNR
ncbi:MAG: T9SS type A sorting domain-containing protein [Ignavibacteriae bacterium]|nr:T9SS type A sorting domain-containing protein [Ignavibacteriota bacterium]